jgi:putative acyl-CoA dehydrogenase
MNETGKSIVQGGMDPNRVLNQSPVFQGHNAYENDPVLLRLTGHLPPGVLDSLRVLGQWTGSPEANELARLANSETPVLKTHDARGNRIDLVEYHPAWHALMRRSVANGLHCSIWDDNEEEKGNRNFIRAARYILAAGAECGHLCPITMTNASVAALMATPGVLHHWLPQIRSRKYDSSQRAANLKAGLLIGMGMTEKQGGTDVRANISTAVEAGEGIWRINGHKWFMSAPMCDAFLVLAQASGAAQDDTLTGQPSCFLVPRYLPDGEKNGLHFQRLKDKLGNRSNASSEVEFDRSFGFLIGEEGRGLRVILEMVTLTRLDCATSSAGLMRAALAEVVHHCRHRQTFGKPLIDQPIMTRVLADMALDMTAGMALSLRLARSFDLARSSSGEAAYARLMTPVVKYWVCKTAPLLIAEAMECLGGNGYVEEGNLARAYREAPVNAIWEGSGNVMCLDVLRVMKKGPRLLATVLEELQQDLGPSADQLLGVLRAAADVALSDEGSARIFTEQLALTAAAAELRRSFGGELADAFAESRLGGPWRATYGMLDARYNARGIVDYVCPAPE